ncbi:MAG: hypothetical protein EP330_13560 [Deltaproteobacteria bacterium]|nr:MAG: hypothetical protein EP330_13560 [Deltaproteobacteria bacterium]
MSEFQVRPFAFMRLTHEAIRICRSTFLAHVEAFAADPSDARLEELAHGWAELRRCIRLHAAQEEAGFFPMLDEMFDGAASHAGFHGQHEGEDAHFERIESLIQACGDDRGRIAELQAAAEAWAADNEHHLKHEEDIMMPLTQKVADTVDGRAAAVKRIIDAADRSESEQWQMPWVLSKLNEARPFGMVRMYAAALKTIHTDEEFARISPSLAAVVGDEAAAKLTAVGAL